MGPHTTTDFMQNVIEQTDVNKDQKHIEMRVVHDPTVPDRTRAILGDGQDPVPQLRDNVRQLDKTGADIIAVPCNTFHYFYQEVQPVTDISIIHMIDNVAFHLKEMGIESVGLLATDGTVKSKLYHDHLNTRGIEVLVPDLNDPVMDAIYRIKSGDKTKPEETLLCAADRLLSRGAEMVIAGCTEVELVIDTNREKFVYPSKILASECVAALSD